jgi:hypothetical protein
MHVVMQTDLSRLPPLPACDSLCPLLSRFGCVAADQVSSIHSAVHGR